MSAPAPGIMTDDKGHPSTMRWISMILTVAAVLFAANEAALFWYEKAGNPILIFYFLGAAIAGKGGQKGLELWLAKPPPGL